MNTFSIATGDYEGFGFRVNPVDTSIVEFVYSGPHIDGDPDDGDHTIIAQFKRNGGLIGVTRVPAARVGDVVRDNATGKPALPPVKPEPDERDLRVRPVAPGTPAPVLDQRDPRDTARPMQPSDQRPAP